MKTQAHALVARMAAGGSESLPFPFLCLLVSGGHNLLVLVKGVGNYTQLGTTLDDALGKHLAVVVGVCRERYRHVCEAAVVLVVKESAGGEGSVWGVTHTQLVCTQSGPCGVLHAQHTRHSSPYVSHHHVMPILLQVKHTTRWRACWALTYDPTGVQHWRLSHAQETQRCAAVLFLVTACWLAFVRWLVA